MRDDIYCRLKRKCRQASDRLSDIWEHASPGKRCWLYLCIYTLAFLMAFLIGYSPFLRAGKAFVWSNDGTYQHLPGLVYEGNYLRNAVMSILHGNFEIPMFDLSLGLGSDVFGYLEFDPLMLLAMFFPFRYMEGLYGFLAIFRVYLAGLSFSYLCRYFKRPVSHALIGSIVYCFSGYAYYTAMRHPGYISPMIQLPLLVAGLEKILKRDKPYLFIAAVFYAALCGYYHLYMMTIMLGVYGLVRFFDLRRKGRKMRFIGFVLRGIGSYVLGIGLSAVVLIPGVIFFLDGNRGGFSNYNPANYSLGYFKNRFLQLFAPSTGSGWTCPALAAIVMFALVLLFLSKGRRTLKIMTAVAFATWLTSAGGMIMNGFQYPSNRWTFGLVLVTAFCVVEMLPELLELKGKRLLPCMAMICVFVGVIFFFASGRKFKYSTVGLCFLVLTLFCLTFPIEMGEERNGAGTLHARMMRTVLCLCLVILNAGVNGIYMFAADQADYIAEFHDAGYETERLETSLEREMEPYLANNPGGRADSSMFTRNTAMVWHIPGMLTYNSCANGNVIEFWNAIEMAGNDTLFNIKSTDQKTIANTLLSEKYHIEPMDRAQYAPYGYDRIEETPDSVIYENQYALPWGYTYDTAMSYRQLEGLNGIQKQEAMLQAVALDDTESVSEEKLVFDEQTVPYEISFENCGWNDGKLEVLKANAVIRMRFSIPPGSEGYVRLKGLDINDSGLESFNVKVACDDVTRQTYVHSDLYTWYYGRENYLFNLGYSDEERNELTITFPSKGTFKLENIELYALPMDNYPKYVEELREESLENTQWEANKLSGTIDLTSDKILCVSVPYGRGWSAKVDGERRKIFRGNYMFMCLPLTAGYHEIEFCYRTPGLIAGAAISLVSLSVVVGMLVLEGRRKRAGLSCF